MPSNNTPPPFFDAHFHIIDTDYPIIENNGFTPESYRIPNYMLEVDSFEVLGGAVVSGSFQGTDQGYLIHSLRNLGPGFVGVTNLPIDSTDQQILALDEHGIRAARINLFRGAATTAKDVREIAHRVFDLAGWHIELYLDSSMLGSLETLLPTLPAASIDHLGLRLDGIGTLCRLAEQGIRIKATGFGRLDWQPLESLQLLNNVNPECLMFGTDLPSTRARQRFGSEHYRLITDSFDDQDVARILVQNALKFYRLEILRAKSDDAARLHRVSSAE
ncbi:MAG: amidohydrolase family protein [Pseudomonadota bacterium]